MGDPLACAQATHSLTERVTGLRRAGLGAGEVKVNNTRGRDRPRHQAWGQLPREPLVMFPWGSTGFCPSGLVGLAQGTVGSLVSEEYPVAGPCGNFKF